MDNIADLAAALSKAQGAIRAAIKERDNPGFKGSKYADLASVWEACRKPLSENGLAIVQSTDFENGDVWIRTILLHSSGQKIEGRYPLRPVKNDPQGYGSAITYARRYCLAAMVGVAPDDDDDGNAATGVTQNGYHQKTPAQAKRDGDFEKLCAEIDSCNDVTALGVWWKNNQTRIKALPDRKDGPGSWVDLITEHKDKRKAEIEAEQRLREASRRSGIPASADHPQSTLEAF